MGLPLGLLLVIIQGCVALSLLLAAGILVDATIPGNAAVTTFRVLSGAVATGFGVEEYDCTGDAGTSVVLLTPLFGQQVATTSALSLPDETLVVSRVTAEGKASDSEVFQFTRFKSGTLDPTIIQDVDVFQVRNIVTGLCWSSYTYLEPLEQVGCADVPSTIASDPTRRQLFALTLIRTFPSCGGVDGQYTVASIYDQVEGQQLFVTPGVITDKNDVEGYIMDTRSGVGLENLFLTTRLFSG